MQQLEIQDPSDQTKDQNHIEYKVTNTQDMQRNCNHRASKLHHTPEPKDPHYHVQFLTSLFEKFRSVVNWQDSFRAEFDQL